MRVKKKTKPSKRGKSRLRRVRGSKAVAKARNAEKEWAYSGQ